MTWWNVEYLAQWTWPTANHCRNMEHSKAVSIDTFISVWTDQTQHCRDITKILSHFLGLFERYWCHHFVQRFKLSQLQQKLKDICVHWLVNRTRCNTFRLHPQVNETKELIFLVQYLHIYQYHVKPAQKWYNLMIPALVGPWNNE